MNELVIEYFSCYEKTYEKEFSKILNYLYPKDLDKYKLIYKKLDTGSTKNLQAQRKVNKKSVFRGRLIKIYNNNRLEYIVGFSNTNYDLDKDEEFKNGESVKSDNSYGTHNYHSNSYLVQGINRIFDEYYKCLPVNPELKLRFYLLDTDKKNASYVSNLSCVFTYRQLETIGFNILNLEKVNFKNYEKKCKSVLNIENIKFSSINKMFRDFAYISSKNKGNKPSFLEIKENLTEHGYNTEKYIYTFKILSAQGYDNLIKCWCLYILAKQEKKELEFRLGTQYFGFKEEKLKKADKLTKPLQELFEKIGIKIKEVSDKEFMVEVEKSNETYLRYKENKKIRNQALFRSNIRKRGIPYECAVCLNDDPKLLDAAHLWEINTIKIESDKNISKFIKENNMEQMVAESSEKYNKESFYKKYYLANSGDNGIWLCKNHHKLFDSNSYTINEETCNLEWLSDETNKLENQKISEEIVNDMTKAFIKERNSKYFI